MTLSKLLDVESSPEFFHSTERPVHLFFQHAKEYLKGDGTVPVSMADSVHGQITFTFVDGLLKKLLHCKETAKPYEVALKYGFLGHSIGGRNGICYVRDRDTNLLSAVERLIQSHKPAVLKDLDMEESDISKLRPVKIVHHSPSGKRVVGAYKTDNHRIIFLGLAHY